MKKCILFIFGIIFISACQNNENSNLRTITQYDTVYKTITVREPIRLMKRRFENYDLDSLILQVKTKGDRSAFSKVYVYYAERKIDPEILNLSFLMAHKYNYNYAYFLVYCIFIEQHENDINNLDTQSQNFAMYYLARSYELGYNDAMEEYKYKMGEKAILQNSSYYLNKMKLYDQKK